jgi:hypothetical protein
MLTTERNQELVIWKRAFRTVNFIITTVAGEPGLIPNS